MKIAGGECAPESAYCPLALDICPVSSCLVPSYFPGCRCGWVFGRAQIKSVGDSHAPPPPPKAHH